MTTLFDYDYLIAERIHGVFQKILKIESEGTGPSDSYQGVINSSVGDESHHPSVGVAVDPSPGQYVETRLKPLGELECYPPFGCTPRT